MKSKKFNLEKTFKIITLIIYFICIVIYEIGICNGNKIKNFIEIGEVSYNFSLCRIAIYTIFLTLLIKYNGKFTKDAVKTLYGKKKIVLGIYTLGMIITIIYALLRGTSIYKELSIIIALLMGLIFIAYVSTNYIKNVIIITFTFGIVFTFSTDIHHALDEKKHAMSAMNLAAGNFNYSNKPLNDPAYNNIIFNCDIDSFIQFYDKKYEENLTDDWNITEETEIYYISSSPAGYNIVLYIPSTIGVLFAKTLGGSIADLYIMGRLFNLIAYMLLIILILKLLPYKHKVFFVIYMIPFILLLAASFSVDAICIGILGIFIAYCLKLSEMDYNTIKMKDIFILILLYGLCLIVKNFAYCAIALLILILPIVKIIKNNKKYLPILISLFIIGIIICSILFVDRFNIENSNDGDPRGGETSVTGQIEFLLSSPINIFKVVFEHIMNSMLNYNWYVDLNHSVFFGKYSEQVFFLELLFVLYVCITDNSKKIKKRVSIVSCATFITVFMSTSLMLYLSFTPIGQINISGYQPRYMIAILPLIMMLINNKKNLIVNNSNDIDENINLILGLLIIIDLLFLIKVV